MIKKRLQYKHRQNTVRITYEPDYDHEAWESGAEPTPVSEPDAFYRMTEPAHPQPRKASTRRKSHSSLTASKLRRRLYGVGVRGAVATQLLNEILAGEPKPDDVIFATSWNSWSVAGLRQRFGHRVARAILRFVSINLCIMDEFGSYASPGFAAVVQQTMSVCRKWSAKPITVEQTWPAAPTQVVRRVSFQY